MRAECIRAVEELALSDPRVVVIVSDASAEFMPELAAKHPERRLVEGVCEQGLVGMAAGLASEGFYPFAIMIAAFASRRAFEQQLLDFGLHGLSGCMLCTGGGLHYASLGPTHIAVDDMLLMSSIPGAAVLAPGEPNEAVGLARQARAYPGLSFIRMAGTATPLKSAHDEIVLGKGRVLKEPGAVLFISCGAATLEVQSAVAILKEAGIDAGILHLHTVKPLDRELVRRSVKAAKVVLCVEEHRQIGGLSSAVLHALTTAEPPVMPKRFASVGIDDTFPIGYGSYSELMAHYGMTGKALAERAQRLLSSATASRDDSSVIAAQE